MLLAKRLRRAGYTGRMTILREYAAGIRKRVTTEAIIRFETEPGFQAQVDWKELGRRTVDGRVVKLCAFVMLLGYSRRPFIWFTTSMRSAVLLACMRRAFEHFGGVVREVLFDNMKTAFLADSDGVFHPNLSLLTFANHYGFIPRRCRVRRPQTKGKVERMIGFLAERFLPTLPEGELSLEDLNDRVGRWVAEIAEEELRDFAESRADRFAREREFLSPLPAHPADTRESADVVVSRESVFSYAGSRYSAPAQFIGESLIVRLDPLSPREAELYHGRTFIRSFPLLAPGERGPLWFPEDRKSLEERWQREQRRKINREARIPAHPADPEVDTRSPSLYEQFTEEAAG